MLAQLTITFCLLSNPEVCENKYYQGPSIHGCLMGGEKMAADYIKEHPEWFMKKWRCSNKREIES